MVELWTDELQGFSPTGSHQRQILHRNSNSDTSNRQEQEKKLRTQTKLKPPGHQTTTERDHNIKNTTCPALGGRLSGEQNMIICVLKTNKGTLKSSKP